MISFRIHKLNNPIITNLSQGKTYFFILNLTFKSFNIVYTDTRQTITSKNMRFLYCLMRKQSKAEAVYIKDTVYTIPFCHKLLKEILIKLYSSVHILHTNVKGTYLAIQYPHLR